MIRVRQIKIRIEEDNLTNIKRQIIKRLKVDQINNINIIKKSIDARDKNNIYYVYEVDVETPLEDKLLNRKIKDIIKAPN